MDKDNDFIEEPKTERIFIRISDKEKKKLKELTHESGMHSVSDYVRTMALCGIAVQLNFKEMHALVTLLSRIASNLNQLTRKANESGSICRDEILQLQTEFAEIRKTSLACMQEITDLRHFNLREFFAEERKELEKTLQQPD